MSSPELRLLHFNSLLLSLATYLAMVSVQRSHVLPTLFICSGCDYISFCVGLREATMMRRFFENAWFITGTQEFPGTLADTAPGREEQGFLSFVRLIGTVYFKKHLVEFSPTTPHALYTSLTRHGLHYVQQHKQFIKYIWENCGVRYSLKMSSPLI